MLCGRWLDAAEARDAGLVNRVVNYADLEVTASRLGTAIAALEPGVARRLKLAVRRGLDLPLSEGLKLEKRLAVLG